VCQGLEIWTRDTAEADKGMGRFGFDAGVGGLADRHRCEAGLIAGATITEKIV